MNYSFHNQIRNDDLLRKSFNELAYQTFQIDFEHWHKLGYWTHRYIPYVLVDQGKVIANVSCNPMTFNYQNSLHHALQIGTVMTDPHYQGQGLSRFLLEKVLQQWQGKCDSIFLYANETVLDFYPKFNFERKTEYQFTMLLRYKESTLRQLNLDDPQDVSCLYRAYLQSNPYSALTLLDNFPLVMFYCTSFLKDSVFYDDLADVVIIAQQTETDMYCYDIYGSKKYPLQVLLERVATKETKRVILGFTPLELDHITTQVQTEDAFFLLKGSKNILDKTPLCFPFLSHT